jgi:hypothetical protein
MRSHWPALIEGYLDRLDRNAVGIKEAAEEGRTTTSEFNSASLNSEREANTLATELGLKVCSPLDA